MLLALVFVAAACSSGDDPSDTDSASDGSSSGQSTDGGEVASGDLPDVEIELAEGGTTTLGGVLDERPLVVNFFASWCPPCRAEMPDFQTVYADVRERVDFFGVDMQDTKSAGAELVELTGVEYPWGLDPDGRLYAAVDGFSMPTTLFVTAEGEIAHKANGAMSEGQLRSLIEENFGVSA